MKVQLNQPIWRGERWYPAGTIIDIGSEEISPCMTPIVSVEPQPAEPEPEPAAPEVTPETAEPKPKSKTK
jgi:hypothetical protein